MDLTDIVRSASLVVVFLLVAVFADRKLWMTTDILATVGFGATFAIFPRVLLGFQVADQLDAAHLSLARVYGLSLLCSAFIWYITSETRDGTVPITLMMSRVSSCSLTLMVQVYSFWGLAKSSKYWTDQFLWFGILGTTLWLLGNLIHLMKSSDFSTYPQYNIRLNSHLRLDSWLMTVIAFSLVAFPTFIVQHLYGVKANPIHLHICRCLGALSFGESVISLQAPGFLHERDKKAQLCARILWSVLITTPWLASALLFGLVSLNALSHISLLIILPLTNAMIGYFTEANIIYRVPVKNDLKRN
ncbi:hypothetical protein LSH36_90g04009 [Paralvinella palmiformis]|uniref:Uncharacterized protein n=1 Tax=Paralvinella palmiformis TaxID=53620 RepID=A0AAD9NAG0_9ANNE|nr:hypothetical protein LSH36_90g04009 [Paralvinella palmiformis]